MKLFRFSLLAILFISGCSTVPDEYDYGVTVKNIGTKRIWVEKFDIYRSKGYHSVGTGILIPSAESTSFSYMKKPYSEILLQWRFMDGNDPIGERTEKRVSINLPKEFDKKHGRGINFYVNPDDGEIIVTYLILTDFNEEKEINSDGSRFQFPKRLKKKKQPETQQQ